MITADGKFIPYDEYVRLVKEAPIVEITCPKCKRMTRCEKLTATDWYCYECGNLFHVPY